MDASSLEDKGERKWIKRMLCGVVAVAILAAGLWVGVAKFGWFDTSIAIDTAQTEQEVVRAMSRNLTEQLLNDAIAYKNAGEGSREAAFATVRETANRRYEYIESLMREDSDEFLRLAITSDLKESLLEGVDGIEETVTVEGVLEIHEADVEEGGQLVDIAPFLFLVTDDGEMISIYTPESAPVELMPNAWVRIVGYRLNDQIVPNTVENADNFLIIDEPNEDFNTGTPRQVAVILINPSGVTMPANFTVANARNVMNVATNWFVDVSYGQSYLRGKMDESASADIFGPYDIASTTAGCPYNTYHTQGRAAAAADGFVATGYTHYVIFSSSGANCGFSGVATIGGSQVTVIGATSNGTTVHELGHNLGLRHANRVYNCTVNGVATPFADSQYCTGYTEYGDIFDVMGQSSSTRGNPVPFSAFSKHKMGWLPANNMQTVTANGVYEIYPNEVSAIGTNRKQLIRIQMPYTPTQPAAAVGRRPHGNAPFYYFLETRAPVGMANVTNQSARNDFAGIQIRTGSNDRNADTYHYQLGGYSGATEPCTGCITGLRPGMEFRDSRNSGLVIRVLSWTEEKAVVDIRFDGSTPPPPCIRNNPDITISPAGSSASPGGSIDYAVTVKSNDSAECGGIAYMVTPSGASGFSFLPINKSMTLGPGQSESQIFTVTSPSSASTGIYNLTFSISNSEMSTPVTRDTSFTVLNPNTEPPGVAISGIAHNQFISATNNTKITITTDHPMGIAKIEIYINDKVVAICNDPKNNTCDVWVKGSNTAVGTHTVKVEVFSKNSVYGTNSITFRR